MRARNQHSAVPSRVRKLRLWLTTFWVVAWTAGILSLATLAIALGERLNHRQLAHDLEYVAMATYGLSWFDENGDFHDEIFWIHEDLADAPFDIWVLEPRRNGNALLAPRSARFDVDGLDDVAESVRQTGESVSTKGHDRHDAPYRLHARPTFSDEDDQIRGVVLVLGDPTPAERATSELRRVIWTWALALLAVGLVVGDIIARKSVRPLLEHLRQREQFIAAAAHELRTPTATLLAVCESAAAGDEDPTIALQRATRIAQRSRQVIEDLLFYARLEAGTCEIKKTAVRLDLLVEAALADYPTIRVSRLEECVVDLDPVLGDVAVRNLMSNAQRHAPNSERVEVAVSRGEFHIEDEGPGFPDDVIRALDNSSSIVPSRGGSGLGLAIVALVARLHGGALQLESPEGGGARVVLLFERRTS